jgi:hypothetical protein
MKSLWTGWSLSCLRRFLTGSFLHSSSSFALSGMLSTCLLSLSHEGRQLPLESLVQVLLAERWLCTVMRPLLDICRLYCARSWPQCVVGCCLSLSHCLYLVLLLPQVLWRMIVVHTCMRNGGRSSPSYPDDQGLN